MHEFISRALYTLEDQWKKGIRPRLETIVESCPESARDAVALAISGAELELRLKVGDSVLIEDYLRRFPGLTPSPSELLALIRVEFTQRNNRREVLDWVQHYRSRFPSVATELGWGLLSSFLSRRSMPGSPIARLPFTLGGYQLVSQIGAGAFGVVYRALGPDGQAVAIKIPYGGQEAISSDISKLLREKRYATALVHPGIVPVLAGGIDETTGIPYIVYKLFSSINLATQISLGRRFGIAEALLAMANIAEAVEFAHEKKILHRDLKPANLLSDENGRLMVTDFGLALRDGGASSTASLSDTGPVGTLAYMAPEILYGADIVQETSSDLFSLGVILYEIVTGQHPFQGSVEMIINSIQNVDPAPPSKLRMGIHSDVDKICRKVLSKEPKNRHRSAGRLAAELRDAAARAQSGK